MQQLVSHWCPHRFSNEVNALLMDGWRIVPGTMYVKHNPQRSLKPGDKPKTEVYFAVVLENEGVR